MTKKELIKALDKYNDDAVVICVAPDGGWDNIQKLDVVSSSSIEIHFGGGSPFSSDN